MDQYERAISQLAGLDSDSACAAVLCRSIHAQATGFYKANKPAIDSFRRLVARAQSAAFLTALERRSRPPVPSGSPARLDAARLDAATSGDSQSVDLEAGSQTMSATASSIAQAEEHEHELRQQLIVLEEQHFFVSNMLSESKLRREFDQVNTLADNLADLDREINSVRAKLDRIDFSAIYRPDLAAAASPGRS